MDPELENCILSWNRKKPRGKCQLKGPLRVARLCILAILIPGLLIAVPLYLRYRVYSDHFVPLGMSDMRLIDNKISTTWCQRQLVSSNATFNAYLLSQKPDVHKASNFVNLVREIVLEDDMKEYWGFYLLQGSTVTVSSCCSRPGATLIIIKGHHHLHQCAYIGDNSSEEEEEQEEIDSIGNQQTNFSYPSFLQRARTDVTFHKEENAPKSEQHVLKNNLDMNDHGEDFDMSLHEEHKAKTKFNSPKNPPTNTKELKNVELTSDELFRSVINKLQDYQKRGVNDGMAEDKSRWVMLRKIIGETAQLSKEDHQGDGESNARKKIKNNEESRSRRHLHLTNTLKEQLGEHDEEGDAAEEEGVEHEEVRGSINGTTANDTSNSEFWSSFSSSEERLLQCDGLILSHPLIPSPKCRRNKPAHELDEVCSHQKVSYTVPANGYYFFVFSSENEIQSNYIRVHFQLEKMQYNVSNPVATCRNSTGECSLPLNFFSQQRMVLELPVNETLWNNEFLVVSTCEPRTALYIACIVAVPILILLCAF